MRPSAMTADEPDDSQPKITPCGAARRNIGLQMLTVIAALLASTVVPRVFGQDVHPSGPALPKESGALEVDKTDFSSDEPAPTAAAPSDCCCPDFWIISSRCCPDPKGAACCRNCLDYVHRDPDGLLCRKNRELFQAWLRPGVPVCIVVHGSFSNWRDVRVDSHRMYGWIRCAAPHWPLQMVFFTWPSEGPTQVCVLADVCILGRRGARHGIYFAKLISQIPPGHPVTTFGHSHGARTVAAGLHLLGGGEVQGSRFTGPDPGNPVRMVLSAAAIDHHWLNPGERYGRALCRANRLLLLRNREDCVLHLYPLRKPFARRALSSSGFSREDRTRLGWLNAKTQQLDVSRIIGHRHFWHNYYAQPAIARSMAPFIYYADSDFIAPSDHGRRVPATAANRRPTVSGPTRDLAAKRQPALTATQ